MTDLPNDPSAPPPTPSLVARLTLRAQVALKILIRERVQLDSRVIPPEEFADRVTARTQAVLTELERTGDVTYPPELQSPLVDRVSAALDRASAVTGEFQSGRARTGPDPEVRQTRTPLEAYRVPTLTYARDPALAWAGYDTLKIQLISLLNHATSRAAHLVQVPERLVGTPDAVGVRESYDATMQRQLDAVMSAVAGLVRPAPAPPVEAPSQTGLPAHEPPALIYDRDPSLPWDEHGALAAALGRLVRTAGDRAATLTRVSPVAVGLGHGVQPMLDAMDAPLQERVSGVMAAVTDLVREALRSEVDEPTRGLAPETYSTPTGAKLVTTLVPEGYTLLLQPIDPPEDPSRVPAEQLGRVTLGPGQRETVFGVDIAAGPDEHVEAVFDPRTSPPTLVRLVRRFRTVDTETASSAPTPDETSRVGAERAPAGSDRRISSRDADLLNRLLEAVDRAGASRARLDLVQPVGRDLDAARAAHAALSDTAHVLSVAMRDRLAEQGVLPQGPAERGDRVPDDAVAPSLDLLRVELVAADLPPVEGLSPSAQALVSAAVRDVVGVATDRALALATGWPASLDRDTPEGREYLRNEGALPRVLSHLAEVVSRFTDYEEDRDGGAALGVGLLQSHGLPQCPSLGEAENARLGAAVQALTDVVGERAATAATLPPESTDRSSSRDAPGRRLLNLREVAVASALSDLTEALTDVVHNVHTRATRSADKNTVDLLKMVTPGPEPEWARIARGIPEVSPAVDGAPLLVTRIAVPESNARPTEEPDPEHTLPTDAPLAECGGSWLLDLLINMLDESATLVLNDRATPGYLNRVSADIEAVRKELHKRVVGVPVTPHRTYTRIEPTTTLSDLTDSNLVSLTLQLCQDSTLSRLTPTGLIGDPTETSRDFGLASAELYSRIDQRKFLTTQEPAPTSRLVRPAYDDLLAAACDVLATTSSDGTATQLGEHLLSVIRRFEPTSQEPDPSRTETVTIGDPDTYVMGGLTRKGRVEALYGEIRPGQTRVRTEGPPERTTVQLADELSRRVHDLDELMPPDRDASFVEMQNCVTGLKACIDELVLQARVEAGLRSGQEAMDAQKSDVVDALAFAMNPSWTEPNVPPIAQPTGTATTLVGELVHRVDTLSAEVHAGSDPAVLRAWVDSVQIVSDELLERAEASRRDGAPLFESQLARAMQLAEAVGAAATRYQFTIQVLPHIDRLVDYLRDLAEQATSADESVPAPAVPPALARDDLLKLRLLATLILDGFPRSTAWEATRRRAENNHHDLVTKIDQMLAALPTGEA